MITSTLTAILSEHSSGNGDYWRSIVEENSCDKRKMWDLITKSVEGTGYFPHEESIRLFAFYDQIINGRNLDLMCGFIPYVKGSVGLDISSHALKSIKKLGEMLNRQYSETIRFDVNRLSDQIHLPIQGNFDSITLNCGWNYIKDDKTKQLIDEAYSHLKLGGTFYIVQFKDNAVLDGACTRNDGIQEIIFKLKSMGYEPNHEKIPGSKKLSCIYFTKN